MAFYSDAGWRANKYATLHMHSPKTMAGLLEIYRKESSDEHPDTFCFKGIYASMLSEDDFALAKTLLESSLLIQKRVLREGHPHIIITMRNLSNMLGEHPGARALEDSMLETQRKARADEDPVTIELMEHVANMRKER